MRTSGEHTREALRFYSGYGFFKAYISGYTFYSNNVPYAKEKRLSHGVFEGWRREQHAGRALL
jgi:hypothetical protein